MVEQRNCSEERILRAELETAASRYWSARDNYRTVLKLCMEPRVIRAAMRAENRAREKYLASLEMFAKLVFAQTAKIVSMGPAE